MIALDDSFPHRYECDVLAELPGRTPHVHYIPGHSAAGQDGLIVRVRPVDGAPWIGIFAFGPVHAPTSTRLVPMPDPNKLAVVARGAAYIVTAAVPLRSETIASPIFDARAIPAAGIVVMAGDTDVFAYGESGVVWRTKRIAWDGLEIVVIDDGRLIGAYLDWRTDTMQRFEIDLATGETRGGVDATQTDTLSDG